MRNNTTILFLFLILLASVSVRAQFDYGNAWYQVGAPYAKLLVAEDGIYRVNASDLSSAGLSLSGVDPTNLHLYYRGGEVPIFVQETAGTVDFIEFYGIKNDGRIDSAMYRMPATGLHDGNQQPSIYTSLFTDSSAYFLTYDGNPGLRYTDFFDNNYGAYTPETSFRYTAHLEYHPNSGPTNVAWSNGGGSQYDSYHTLNSYWITGEGYVGRGFTHGIRIPVSVPTPHAANLGTPTDITFRVFGRSSQTHVLRFDVNNNVQFTDTMPTIYIKNRSLQYAGNINPTTELGFLALGANNNNTDNNNFCWADVTYSRLFDLDNTGSLKVTRWQDPDPAYFSFANADINSEGIVYDLRNGTRARGTANGTDFDVVIPGAPQSRNLIVATDNGILNPVIEVHGGSNLSDPASGAEFVIITHRSLTNSAQAYATYRDTNTVNQFSTRVVYVDEIYDEFGYGSITPWAIKRFCKYAIDNWSTTPRFFLLWGKGQVRTRNSPLNLVPTAGHPATDYDFVSDYDPFSRNVVPEVPIGRVNVENDQEGLVYLNKIDEYEHTPWDSWMKQTVFLGGGEDTTEQKPILTYLRDYYASEVQGTPLGGFGNYYQKYNTGQITNAPISSTDRINQGASIIHFFGHSSSNIYDVDIQEPSLYQNYGKYPLMIAFGCYGGNFTGNGKSFGERFVLAPERGSIGYLANSTAGFLNSLGNYGVALYPRLFGSDYGEALGIVIQNAHADYMAGALNQSTINHAKQMNLQGDPALVLYSAQKPDLSINSADVFFTPENYSAADSTFTLNVVTRNLGRVVQDSFYFSVRQQTPQNGQWISYPTQQIGPIVNEDTLQLTIRNTVGQEMAGLNTFDIFVDSTDRLDEYREDNNRLQYNEIIPGNIPAVLFPYDFSIVGERRVQLGASAFVMSNQQNIPFVFEIDTVPEFNSPRRASSGSISGSSALATFEVPFDLEDSTVYYWRVRLRDVIPAAWASASFKYIENRTGWAQSRPPQFFRNPTRKVEMSEINREWIFDKYNVDLSAFVNEGNNATFRLANGAWRSDLPAQALNGVCYTAIRRSNLVPTFQNTVMGDWNFSTLPGAQGDFVQAITAADQGDYFLIVSQRNPNTQQWDQGTFNAMALLGADVDAIKNRAGLSFIVFARVGHPNECITITAPNVVDPVSGIQRYDLRKTLEANYSVGRIRSAVFGPSTSYDNVFWNWNSSDVLPEEEILVDVYAVQSDLVTDSLVYSGLERGDYPLNGLNANRFPYLRLEAALEDTINQTAPQLKHWHVVYTPAPDAVIDPSTEWSFDRDTLLRGEEATVRFTARNVTEWDMDSLLVRFTVLDANRNSVYTALQRYAPLTALTDLQLSHSFSTQPTNFSGDMLLQIELNPNDDQPEQYFFNNFYSYGFHIIEDEIDPIVDVTVDGQHLMQGDIVSPEPEILIEINDENQYLAVSDTAFEIHFGSKTPNPANLPRVFIDGNPNMEIVPAQLPDNKAQLFFRPGTLPDGTYSLRVQGYDHSGNAGGKTAYEIDFEVVNAATLSDVLNYPNPFSTSTRFVYTLTGSELPERFEVHIFTITGKLVRVVDLVEENDVRIGTHMTEFTWDGRDEFGDQLANGVYVYKVVAKLNGQDLDYRDEGVSQVMDNGFGKMYLMR